MARAACLLRLGSEVRFEFFYPSVESCASKLRSRIDLPQPQYFQISIPFP